MNIKFQINRTLKAFSLMAAMLLAIISANAQCSITTSSPPCVGQPITFACGAINASGFSWDFGNGNTNLASCNPSNIYAAPGTYTVKLTLKQANGQPCTTSFTIKIVPSPVINVRLLSNATACFVGNSFCFVDSTKPSSPTGCIKSVKYAFSDGEIIKATGVSPTGVVMPYNFCKSFTNPAGGTYDMQVEIEDCNGCITRKLYPSACKVLASMGLSFSSPKPKACDSVKLTVTNTSLIDIADIDSFRWDWGDGKHTNTPWKPTASHTFYSTGPVAGNFNTKLTVWSKFGCKESFTFFSSATNILLNPKIIADFDSVCVDNPIIEFQITGGAIPQAVSPNFNFGDPNSGNLNNSRTWSAIHLFVGGVGPYKIKFTYSHPICGNKEIYDTILVLGPSSGIEGPGNWLIDTLRYQCVIKDTVKFNNISTFYHNDFNMSDDDSTFVIKDSIKYDFKKDTIVDVNEPFDKNYMIWLKPGFNAPLVHVFKKPNGNQTYQKASPQQRGNSCVFRVWDFADDFCEKCTTDSKFGVNAVLKNCRYSKDTLPQHWYTPWDSIYQTKNSMIAAKGMRYDKDSGQCFQVNIWPDKQMAIIRDTFLYYGDNPLGISARDSIIYKNIKADHKIMVPAYLVGPARWDASTFAPRFYLRKTDTAYIDNNNGFAPNLVKGSKYQTVQMGQSIILKSKTDTARWNYWIVYIQDTIANNLVEPWHKVWKTEAMLGYNSSKDSINAALHRDKYYLGPTVRCFNVTLFHKDFCHPMECENQATALLALTPPSAKRLRKEGTLCLGSARNNYGITFILSDTKPGCSRTYASINFDTALNPTGWVNAIGPNLSAGAIKIGNLPPGPFPYLGYAAMGPAGSRFSTRYTTSMIQDSITGYISVGLLVGNGIWRNPNSPPADDLNYPQSCIDTIYYHNFARFPILDGAFRIVKPKEGPPPPNGATKICRNDTICMTLMPKNRTYVPDVQQQIWRMQAPNVGKYYDKPYNLFVQETYERFKKDPTNPNHLLDYLTVEREEKFDNKLYGKKDSTRIQIAEIIKWHTEADYGPVFDIIGLILAANNIDIYDLTPTQMNEIIWNGIGTFGKPYTGARGCLDTSKGSPSIGSQIRFYEVVDSSVTNNFRDTSLLPMDSIVGWDGKKYQAYCFVPRYSGYYVAQFTMRSRAPENCDMATGAKTVIVGFYGKMNYNDTILCHGQDVTSCPEFFYFATDPNTNFGCPDKNLDCVDYWYNRQSEAGQPDREGKTRWDLSKADDDFTSAATIAKTVFGPYPYGQTGVGKGTPQHCIQLGGVTIAGAIYYLSDTGGYYQIRCSTADSTGCKDTFPQDIFVTSVKAKFSLDQKRPQCKSIIEFTDSSKVFDPCVWKLNDICDYIKKWELDWGDQSRSAKNVFFDQLPPVVGHDYTRNGKFKVKLKVTTYLGCTDTFEIEVYIPGPLPKYDTLIPTKYCVNERVNFTNLSTYTVADSSIWYWEFGYNNAFANQYDTIIAGVNDTIHYEYPKPGRYQVYLTEYFKLRIGNTVKTCSVIWPDTTDGQMKAFYIDIFDYDTVKLLPRDTSVCLNQPVTVNGHVTPAGRYSSYIWNLGLSPTDTLVTTDTTRILSYNKSGVYTVKFKGDKNSVSTSTGKVCPAQDSMKIRVADIQADFDIDTTGSPVFCFENKSTNQVDNRWSLFNSKDIMTVNPASARVLEFQITGPEANEPKPCRDYRDSQGAYWVCLEATNSIGCKDTICKLLINNFEASIRPPNVFTPDNGAFKGADKEGLTGNDVFNIEIKGEDKYELYIYDRWGVKVFESTDSKVDWNGKVKNTGAPCPDGNYFYILHYRYKGLSEDEPVLNGVVQIIR